MVYFVPDGATAPVEEGTKTVRPIPPSLIPPLPPILPIELYASQQVGHLEDDGLRKSLVIWICPRVLSAFLPCLHLLRDAVQVATRSELSVMTASVI